MRYEAPVLSNLFDPMKTVCWYVYAPALRTSCKAHLDGDISGKFTLHSLAYELLRKYPEGCPRHAAAFPSVATIRMHLGCDIGGASSSIATHMQEA